ncbi:SAM-dependent methyltransferase [Rugosimonospora acidiphila]|uniref:SAM-dependent methyltransferase n=1 Tax=Rugosimonospora acidiphila TaxID=556531 RepID=A0ABP9SL26_9ACTN
MRWRQAIQEALYGPDGFFVSGDRPADHFRTSVHASPLFAGALARLLVGLDEALGGPPTLDVVDVGAGRGELLLALADAVPGPLLRRLRPTAVELAPRPPYLPPAVHWSHSLPASVTGLLIATEWLDNVPVDLAGRDTTGPARYVHVDDSLGEPVSDVDAAWLDRWWPLASGHRAEIGVPREEAWRSAVSTVRGGYALAVDYGHLAGARPALGTLTGFRAGRQVPPVPDGSTDLTAHVAFDALADAVSHGVAPETVLVTQREALRGLGVSGARPPLSLASTDPTGYVRGLARAGQAAELTDPAGLGSHFWLLSAVGVPVPFQP